MSTDARAERARRWLGEQIDQLKALRNAKTRDSDFKQWRQATLTIIQRIWAGDARRSARFRRIPFSPPSTQADGREMREFYERGCAEALQLLTAGLEEIEKNGLPAETASARPASLDPGVAEDDFPTLDLPGVGAEAAVPSEPAESEDLSTSERPRSNGVSVRGEKDDDRAEHGGSSLRQGAAERRRRQKKGGPRRRLRDMLGLDALEKLAGDRDAPAEVSEIKARGWRCAAIPRRCWRRPDMRRTSTSPEGARISVCSSAARPRQAAGTLPRPAAEARRWIQRRSSCCSRSLPPPSHCISVAARST
jgi:hypothetical protein